VNLPYHRHRNLAYLTPVGPAAYFFQSFVTYEQPRSTAVPTGTHSWRSPAKSVIARANQTHSPHKPTPTPRELSATVPPRCLYLRAIPGSQLLLLLLNLRYGPTPESLYHLRTRRRLRASRSLWPVGFRPRCLVPIRKLERVLLLPARRALLSLWMSRLTVWSRRPGVSGMK
jgi:hypothetical protein